MNTSCGLVLLLILGGKVMDITIREMKEELFIYTAEMITELMNYHRKLNNAPKEFWQTDEESEKSLKEWLEMGEVYNIFLEGEVVGFFYIRFGGQKVAWLEDIFIAEEYRKRGIGKLAIKKLDELMIERNITSMFVSVIPRNTSALKLYRDCGFDHLNMIELRKNYDKRLDKEEEAQILGFDFKKY